MFEYETKRYETNESLNRTRRHISFVNLWNESLCYYPEERNPSIYEMCLFVRSNPSCAYFVQYIDYLKLLFCTFHLNWSIFYGIVVAMLLIVFYSLIYIAVKYFCLPNFRMLMEVLPISPYAYSFAYSGVCIFMPEYLMFWLSCPYQTPFQASLVFAKKIGDVLRYFAVGLLMLCFYGHHVKSVLWWNNMAFIIVGLIYLIWVVSHKYEMFGNPNLAYEDSHLLRFNAWTILFVFILVMFLVVFISYHKKQQKLTKTASDVLDDIYGNSELPSELEITGAAPIYEGLSKFQIWMGTVNGYHNMKERHKFIVIIFTPFYFLLANIIPVMDKQRPMNGWCKPVVCISFLIFPLIFFEVNPDTTTWFGVLICSWIFAFFVFISFNSLREPNVLSLSLFSIVGNIGCSVCLQTLFSEINNLTWQYLSMQMFSCPDLICVMCLSSGEVIAFIVMIYYLIRDKMLNAAYGAVMSIVSHAVYTTLPLIALHSCYTKNTYVMCTSDTKTCYTFFLVIFFSALFHVAMSGNEFRMSLFFHVILLYSAYLSFQITAYLELMQPFGSLHNIRPPRDMRNRWA